VSPNNLGAMVTSFLDAHKGCTKGMVKARMLQILDKLDSDFTEQKMKNTKSSNMVLTSTRFLQR
jgi:beta-glucanase (GH16 family)